MEVLDQLAANPVTTATPGVQEGAGVQTLTTAEEDSLSRRSEVMGVKVLFCAILLLITVPQIRFRECFAMLMIFQHTHTCVHTQSHLLHNTHTHAYTHTHTHTHTQIVGTATAQLRDLDTTCTHTLCSARVSRHLMNLSCHILNTVLLLSKPQ